MKAKILIKELKETFPGQEPFEARILKEAENEIVRLLTLKGCVGGNVTVHNFRVIQREFTGWYESVKIRTKQAGLSWGLLPINASFVITKYEKEKGLTLDLKSNRDTQSPPRKSHKRNRSKDDLVDA